jgi:hypothetical protein
MENIETEVKQEEVVQDQDPKALLAGVPGFPPKDQIDAWKSQFGEISCSAFSDEELFVWHPVSRQSYSAIQMEILAARQQNAQVTDTDVEMRTVAECLLWSSEEGTKSLDTKGGSISSLYEQIMFSSNFLPPAMATSMIIKL